MCLFPRQAKRFVSTHEISVVDEWGKKKTAQYNHTRSFFSYRDDGFW